MSNVLSKYVDCDETKIMDKPTANSNKLPQAVKVLLECNGIILLMLSLLWLN